MRKFVLAVAVAAASMQLIPVVSAQTTPALKGEIPAAERGPEGRERAGVLSCTIEGGVGLLIGSSKGVSCEFKNRATQNTETYVGRINKFGLDVGITGEQYMRWVVFGPQGPENVEGFAGTYRGVSAGAGLVVAFGANALIGGSDKNFVLQPVSAQVGGGLNIALGVASMKIERTN